MQHLEPLPPDGQVATILGELERPLANRLYGPIAAAGEAAPPPVLTRLPFPVEVRHSPRSTTLTASSYDQDPLVVRDGGLIRAPASERAKLERLRDAGVDPDLVWILREIPGRWEPGQEWPHMTSVETARPDDMQHVQVAGAAFEFGQILLHAAVQTAAVLAKGAAAGGKLAGRGALAIASAPLALPLDPIVIGGVVHPESGAVAWVPLAAWDEVDDGRRH